MMRLTQYLGWDASAGAIPWNDARPIREELFGIERLEQHGRSLAAAHRVVTRPLRVPSLQSRLPDNAAALLATYRASAREVSQGRSEVPAAEWLLDNYHLVEAQIREIREDLSPGYYRQLPKLADGPFAGYPRVFDLSWAFVAHNDSQFDPETLRHYLVAYQSVEPLTIGELWAVAITLRIVLVENLRRLGDQITAERRERASADELADDLLAPGRAHTALFTDIATRHPGALSEQFAAQLSKRLRDQDPRTTPALDWLEQRLAQQDATVEDVVRHVQERQGAANVSVRNVITSMRLVSETDWADLFESVSLVHARLCDGSGYAAMDFPSRNLYRSAIEDLSRGSSLSELEVTDRVLSRCRDKADGRDRTTDPGWHLLARGRRAFEAEIGFHPSPRLWASRISLRLGIGGYVGAIMALTSVLVGLSLWALWLPGLGAGWLTLWALCALWPASEAATAIIDRFVTWSFGANTLPGLELKDGIPPELRTLVAVPTLLTTEAALREQVERLEVHHLSGNGGDMSFALLTDGRDADTETVEGDAQLLALAAEEIAALNRRYPPESGGARFRLLHRRRDFNPGEGVWMGWERKRGKLHELNRLLRGATDTSFVTVAGVAPDVPEGVRYVITLDADTRLPRDAAARLVGKMAHPLNRPVFDNEAGRVVEGYGILQPRITPALPTGQERSLYQRTVSGPGGMDPYAAAVSDVYQDLFGEGSYTGKGIYDVDAFEASLAGRVPENAMLSHDLFEGIFARAGLASDVELIEDFPSRYDVAAKRQHRWTRGDWQLLPWLLRGRLPAIGRGKMLDNLRRSLLAPFALATLGVTWLLPLPAALTGTLLLLAALPIPPLLPLLSSILPRRAGLRAVDHLRTLAGDLRQAAAQTFFAIAFLPDHARRMLDAIVRTLVRLYRTRRRLLEWTTAAQSSGSPRLTLEGFARGMSGGVALGLGVAAAAVALAPANWPLILPFSLLWLGAPAVALWVSRPPTPARRSALTDHDARELRLIARQTWRYFETFVTPAENFLPPDNHQEVPRPVTATRTSPTNIGLYLLSAVAARDFGWAGTAETIERLEASLATIRRLPKLQGHFYNWYDTRDLRVLEPAYVSSVDSGNLAGHLVSLANACEEWARAPQIADARVGLLDGARLALGAIGDLPPARAAEVGRLLEPIAEKLAGAQPLEEISPALLRMADKASTAATSDLRPENSEPDLNYWIGALRRGLMEHDRDRTRSDAAERLTALGQEARRIALAMNFAFLLDPDRKLLSIGYSAAENSLDPSCYDLLASEARLASLFAIAKGDAPTRHWFRLGRTATPVGAGAALVSWSGSMFEYLMPLLVMAEPPRSLLAESNRLVVRRQQAYGRSLGVPWGVSESAFNARDLEFTYQYSNFGVPGLGLKRGLADDVVIAPYATALAAMVDPHGAALNYERLASMGARGRYGFYEALDFTATRLPESGKVAIVRSFMAHHQGMTIVAIANVLLDGRMQERFHREPMIKASELLLQERMPRDVPASHPRAEEVRATPTDAAADVQAVRRYEGGLPGVPVTHLMSNGRYSVMLTAAGGGYSRWGNLAVTRWREDPTRDDWGSFIYLRDMASGAVWSPGRNPVPRSADRAEVQFTEDRAEFTRLDGRLTTTLDVVVSGEDDGEVRRVSLVNGGRTPREIEVTSYAELVLAPPASDAAHPAFSKLFVQTEYLPEYGALIATRRPRSPSEPPIWAAHFAVVEGEPLGAQEHETDRARFLGRGNSPATAAAINAPLSGTVGTVLDPVFSLRQRLRVPPGRAARVAFWTVVAPTRDALLDLIDMHHDRSAFERARTLAWTQAQVQLRHLDIKAQEAADFQRLAAAIVYTDARLRAPPSAILKGAGPQSDLWRHGISGDLPIVLLRIGDIGDIAQVRQILRAHEYWRMKRLAVDLVIINEHPSSYIQDLQTAIETAVRSSQSRPRFGRDLAEGAAHVLRADTMPSEARALLAAVARVNLSAARGSIAEQLALFPAVPATLLPPPARRAAVSPPAASLPELEFFNGVGGFAKDGREYVTILDGDATTPAPWINVIANPGFGFQVSAEGSGYTWAENSRENQLTPWSNDPVADPAGEALYVRDEATGDIWTATAQPIRDGGRYIARHGFGYSRFEHEAHGIALDLLHYVPRADPIRISRLTLRNTSGRARRLSVTAYAEWVLGTSRGASAPHIVSERDNETGALMVRNPWSTAFPGRVAFADLNGCQSSWTADRSEFLGRGGSPSSPSALELGAHLSGGTGAALDPCAALARTVELAPGESAEVVSFLGQAGSAEGVRELVRRYRAADLDGVLAEVEAHWARLLTKVQVETPDRAMDVMLNGWLLYQTIACRIEARAAFYQASGAYGFRDQLQDSMALSFAAPETARAQLLRAASRQFLEGDVQHWWLPHSGQGVRTRISDDRVWLAYAAAAYVQSSGDVAVLDAEVPFLEGPQVPPDAHDAFFVPSEADETASLFEHCARGLDQCLGLTGAHGLPLIGTGDWNDGMNRVGEHGQGESVWLGWLLLRTIAQFAPLADIRDPARAARWRAHGKLVREALEREAWDGAWYRRATFDDGSWLGTGTDDECRIDSIAQSWAVLSGAADPGRAALAMASLDRELIRRDTGLALLFTPPFDTTPRDPGYIKAYPPGLRENGGQYSHAAMWAVLAFAEMGDGDKAAELFALLNPINHARTPAEVRRYKVEPYVVAADVYSVPPHAGRGGWTWYTGSAAWMYRAGIEGILGLRREGTSLVITPRLPSTWPGFSVTIAVGAATIAVQIIRGAEPASVLDGVIIAAGASVLVPLDGLSHDARIVLSK
ncbi:GH36-type glycosyl hydrolase domain-containing protein [Paracoccus sp. (in: a-proteobacteria)]